MKKDDFVCFFLWFYIGTIYKSFFLTVSATISLLKCKNRNILLERKRITEMPTFQKKKRLVFFFFLSIKKQHTSDNTERQTQNFVKMKRNEAPNLKIQNIVGKVLLVYSKRNGGRTYERTTKRPILTLEQKRKEKEKGTTTENIKPKNDLGEKVTSFFSSFFYSARLIPLKWFGPTKLERILAKMKIHFIFCASTANQTHTSLCHLEIQTKLAIM